MNAHVQVTVNNEQARLLREEFFGWQCRVRQIAMRKNEGRPDDAIMPIITLPDHQDPLGSIITVLCKTPGNSATPEMQHLARKTSDEAERRKKAIEFLSATYYQKPQSFSDVLTATFAPNSHGARAICDAPSCTLVFTAYGQRFDIHCKGARLSLDDPLYQATWWHNFLFNASLHPKVIIIGFEPDWANSSVEMMDGF